VHSLWIYLEVVFIYWNFEQAYSDPSTFVLVIGGRGCGKTYGAVKKIISDNIPTLWIRRSQIECDNASAQDTAFVKSYCIDNGMLYKSEPIPKTGLYTINIGEDDNNLFITGAISTFKNVRGMDFKDRKLLVIDELIPEAHTKKQKNFPDAFLNMYETVNRNRELEGDEAIKCIMLSNSNKLDCDLLAYLDLIPTLEKMMSENLHYKRIEEKDLSIILLGDSSDFTQKKKETALYKLSKGTQFYEMSIGNKFSYDDMSAIRRRNLREYKQLITIDDIAIWEHKTNESYYVTTATEKFNVHYTSTDADKKLCNALERVWLLNAFMEGKIIFSSYKCKTALFHYFDVI